MGRKILQKWGLQPPFNSYNNLRERVCTKSYFNHLSANPTKWPNSLKQKFINKLSTNCLSMFDHFVRLAYGDTTQFVCLWKKLAKQAPYFLYIYIYIYHLLSKYWKKTMFNQKTSKNLIKWTFFEVSRSKVAF